MGLWKACGSKKGISALQLSREMEISHKSALFVLRRIRHGLGAGANAPKLSAQQHDCVFSLIKRGVMGTFHGVSRKHLPNFLNEFEFRWNTRKLDDGQHVPRRSVKWTASGSTAT